MITLDSVVAVADDLIAADLGEEIAILQLSDGIYYGLDAVGARIWSLIQEPTGIQAVLDTLLAEYDVEPARCQSDLMALLQQLASEKLIVIRDGAATA